MRKIIPRRIANMFMHTFIMYYRQTGYIDFLLSDKNFSSLRERPDYRQVLNYLEAKNYIALDIADGEPYKLVLTSAGIAFYENRLSETAERWWNRGLSILAVLISLAALLLEFQARGWLFPYSTPDRTPQALCEPTPSVSPEPTRPLQTNPVPSSSFVLPSVTFAPTQSIEID